MLQVLMNNGMTLGSCDPGCLTCSSYNPSFCLSCVPGFYMMRNTFGTDSCILCNPQSYCYNCNKNNSS